MFRASEYRTISRYHPSKTLSKLVLEFALALQRTAAIRRRNTVRRSTQAPMALLPWEFEKRASIRASISAAEKFGNDGTPDAREDQLNDRITPLVLSEEEMSRAEPPEDDMDARDAAAHRKKTAVWSLKQRKAKASFRESSPARDQQFDRRAPFDPVEQERRMLRDQEAPGVVWTIGEDSLGQCGHAAARPDDTPYPAPIEPKRLKGGVRSIHAGPVELYGDVGRCREI